MFNQIKKHTQKKAPSRCRAVIHMEIPGDESCAELGSLEDSFSSVFSEHFSLTKSESICQLWEISSPYALEWACLPDFMTFCSTRCQATKASPAMMHDAEAAAAISIPFVKLCLRGLTLKTSICLSLYDFQVLHSHRKPSTKHLHWRLVLWANTAISSGPSQMDTPLVSTSWIHSLVWPVPKISRSWRGRLEGGWHSPHWGNKYLWLKDWRMVSQSSLCYYEQLKIFALPHEERFDNYRNC